MKDWTQGYVADMPYTFGFLKEMAPSHLRFALVAKGVRPPRALDADVAYCELGFGQGYSLNILAAANPRGTFWGTDFNPAHAAGARLMAEEAGLTNIHVVDDAFEGFLDRETPLFDVIALHGVYSWISPENREKIAAILEKKLKVGGIVYISYNALPGWSVAMPMRELIFRHAGMSSEPTALRVDRALDFVQRVAEAQAGYFRSNPGLMERLEGIQRANRNYVAHEYFNQNWNPLYFSEVAQELGVAKVSFAASTDLSTLIEPLVLAPAAQQLLNSIPDPEFRETVRDYCVNTQFRRDLFLKGSLPLTAPEAEAMLSEQRYVLSVPRCSLKLKVNLGVGEATLDSAMYSLLADALIQEPRSFAEVMAIPELAKQGAARVLQALTVLCATNQAYPCLGQEGFEARKAACDRFNAAALEGVRYRDQYPALASPVTGSGHTMSRMELLFLRAWKLQDPDPVGTVWGFLELMQQRLILDGKTLQTREENLAELRACWERWLQDELPLLRALGLAG